MKKENFRKNVALILINRDKKILLCEHIWINDAWQLPQGGVRENETEEEALYREMNEEIGTTNFVILDKMDRKLTYKYPNYLRKKYSVEGQIQRFFLAYFYGDDKEIRFDNQEKPEFQNYEWVDYNIPPTKVIYFKKISYLKALEYFERKYKKLDVKNLNLDEYKEKKEKILKELKKKGKNTTNDKIETILKK